MATASNVVGQLSVRIIQAKNFKKCDPYFKIVVDDLQTTSSKKSSCTEGKWNETLTVDLDGSQDHLELQLWDYDRWTKDDVQDTSGTLDLCSAISNWNGQGPTWVNLNKGSKVQIDVVLHPKN